MFLYIRVSFGSGPYFRYRNIGTIQIFKGFLPVPFLGILVRFRFRSSGIFSQA